MPEGRRIVIERRITCYHWNIASMFQKCRRKVAGWIPEHYRKSAILCRKVPNHRRIVIGRWISTFTIKTSPTCSRRMVAGTSKERCRNTIGWSSTRRIAFLRGEKNFAAKCRIVIETLMSRLPWKCHQHVPGMSTEGCRKVDAEMDDYRSVGYSSWEVIKTL